MICAYDSISPIGCRTLYWQFVLQRRWWEKCFRLLSFQAQLRELGIYSGLRSQITYNYIPRVHPQNIHIHSRTLLSPFLMSWNLTSVNSPSSSALASFNASSTVQTFLRRNQLMKPPPFLTSSCVATQYFARNMRCARTPFLAPRLSCWAEDMDTSWSPWRKASVCSGGSALAIGLRASWGMPCGV